MESKAERREAIRQFKERKTEQGAFAVRCVPSGETWVGVSRNLGATPNGAWFALRMGSHLNRAMQKAWNEHGESAFAFEILERLPEDVAPLNVSDDLKRMHAQWLQKLGAQSF